VTFSFLSRRGAAALLAGFATAVLALAPAYAQSSAGPQPAPLPPPIIAPADTPYPGTLTLMVDATNVNDRIFNVHETIPVKAGKLVLLYPEWLPGAHSPANPVVNLAGLVLTANGNRVDWVRDQVNMYAFHVNVPKGVTSLEANFQYLAPINPKQGRISSNFADVTWISTLLYPAGYFSRRITFSPSIRLPEGWKFACALETKSQDGNLVEFKDTTLNTLIDSPLYAGVNFKRVDMSTGPDNQVFLDLFADKPSDLEATPEQIQFHKNLVIEAQKLFASHHYDHYDFLFSLSDVVSGSGLEHHQSSEDGEGANYFTDWAANVGSRSLLPHEYTHSWNGKFRRPYDLWTPNFNWPMQDDLLWVYEGLTDYYGNVLASRSGLCTPDQTRDIWAMIAANFEISPGRTWRTLVDTTNQPIISSRRAVQLAWPSWQRTADYYPESDLIWLDADTKIRELSGGKKSLDDFAKLFYGIDNGSYITKTYTLTDLITALNTVQPFDWGGFFRDRVYDINPKVPENGFTQGGYKLVYNDVQSEWTKHQDPTRGASFATSLGFSVNGEGNIGNVWWNSLAFKAGIVPDMQLQAVNDQKYTAAVLREAIVAAEKTSNPIKLLLKNGDQFLTINLDYHGGPRYPHLERVEGTEDRLDAVLAPSK
jgi:predicted metalloprotease with PDZ domain